MRLFYTIVVGFILMQTVFCQEGFLNSYSFDGTILSDFSNCLLKEDTIVLFGVTKVDSTNQQGIIFAKADTFGNILDHKIIVDSLGDYYTVDPGYDIITTSDGGFVMLGNLLSRNHGVLIKTNSKGQLDFIKEYPDTSVLNTIQSRVVETASGFLIAGHKALSDYTLDIYVMKTDRRGNKLWEKHYGETDVHEAMRSFLKIDSNTFVIGSVKSDTDSRTLEDSWGKSYMLSIDSNGNKIWEWEQDEINTENGVRGLNYLPDGSFVYVTSNIKIVDPEDPSGFRWKGKIVKRDKNFNIVWKKELGTYSSNDNRLMDLVRMHDKGWVAIGEHRVRTHDPNIPWPLSIWTCMVSNEGDSLWSRLDTVKWHPYYGTEHFSGGLAILPTGSIIGCGYNNSFYDSLYRSRAWLMKVNKHGCIQEGCNPVSDVNNERNYDISIFPNPVVDVLNIHYAGLFDVEVYTFNGILVAEKSNQLHSTQIELGNKPTGVYSLKITINNEEIVYRKFINL